MTFKEDIFFKKKMKSLMFNIVEGLFWWPYDHEKEGTKNSVVLLN